jgi:hypothetical protein
MSSSIAGRRPAFHSSSSRQELSGHAQAKRRPPKGIPWVNALPPTLDVPSSVTLIGSLSPAKKTSVALT